MVHDLGDATYLGRDHRLAVGHRLQQGQGQPFGERRQDEDVGCLEEVSDVISKPQEPHPPFIQLEVPCQALEGRALRSIRRTLAEVFAHVDAFALVPEGPITNVVFYASDAPLALPWTFESELERLRIRLDGGTVLTDQRNPTNHWNAPWARKIRATREKRY